MDNHIKGKVIVVTGAASGFGALVCQKAAALGAKVVGLDIDEANLAAMTAGIKSAGGEAMHLTADVRSRQEMFKAADAAVQACGCIDVMVNNAGVMPLAFHADHEAAAEAWERCIDINFKGVVNGISAVHDQMIKQGRGHIVNLASIYGNYPVAGGGVYGATKAAVVFLSESLRVESQGKIKVTIVRPTGVPQTNLATGIVNPEAVVGLLGAKAASALASFEAAQAGQLPAAMLDKDDIAYFSLDPDSLADQIVYAINQPWGVMISDITVRASGDGFIA